MVSVDLLTVLMRDTGPIDQIEDKIDVLLIDREDAVYPLRRRPQPFSEVADVYQPRRPPPPWNPLAWKLWKPL